MKLFFSCLAVVALLTVGAAGAGHYAVANQKPLQWPNEGMAYAAAKVMLLKQGLKIAPDKPAEPDAFFPECDRQSGLTANKPYCEVLFIQANRRGWQAYVVVWVDLATGTVRRADYPSTPEGHPSIPPPLPKTVPQLKGSYLEAREKLKALGFTPARFEGERVFNTVKTDESFKHEITISEAWCSGTGMSFCTAYWIAKNGRVLKVTTIWEFPQVYYVEWSSRKELRRDQRDMRD